jgi:integrase
MGSTRTPGITVDANGVRVINKEHHGDRLFLRLGQVSQDAAEQRLRTEIERMDLDRSRQGHARPLFRHCAARYLAQSRNKRSVEVIEWHVRILIAHLGDIEPHKVHDGTLEPFILARIAAGASATTINRSLEVARTILNRAARAYRDDDGIPWLNSVPPLITMLPESRRSPYPITWDEQDRLVRRLPPHLATMALFAVNTGLRDSNLCGLQWMWEVHVPEIARSVFIVPPEAFKSKRPHVVILNDAAWSIVQSQRGKHPIWVFPYRGKSVRTMNNTSWQNARRALGLSMVRVHDLRHTFGGRLRAAGVSHEDRAALLGHACHSMPALYASPDICRLTALANRVLERIKTVTVLRIVNG